MTAETGNLNLGHILAAVGVTDLDDVLAIRHTNKTLGGIGTSADATPASLLKYTRHQDLKAWKIPQNPARTWLVFMADGARRSRFVCAYENRGEVLDERTSDSRFFDLRESEVLTALRNRLVIEWSKDAINWAKGGESAAAFPLVEIADPNAVPFPGFDRVVIPYEQLVDAVTDHRYNEWQVALSSVQGIYLIVDSTNGKQYVGKADGQERILGRWRSYARDGHGGNVALRDLAQLDASHARHFVFSILRVFGPGAIASEVDEAEAHYKKALLTRRFGMNSN